MRAVFMGSPAFAVPCLQALHERAEVVGVVCQPDKPAGRGLGLSEPAVKIWARERGLPVLQPPSLRPDRSPFVEELRALRPELVVVVAYGKILPQAVLDVPARGCWNVHASILPRSRGAAPIQWALIQGERVTGVTLMQMDAGMDTGPALLGAELAIAEDDTSGTLHGRLSQLGAELLAEGLQRLQDGTLPAPVAQDHARATRAPLLDKEHGRADFTRPARLVSGQLRGVDPWPGAFTTAPAAGGEVIVKLFRPRLSSGGGRPGEVLGADGDGLHVACGDGAVAIAELQLPGRKRLPAQAVLTGFLLPRGTILGGGAPNPLLDPDAPRTAPQRPRPGEAGGEPMRESARDVARRVLGRVEEEAAYATLTLDAELRRAGLSPRDRGLATEIVYGVLRQRLRLDRTLNAYAPRGTTRLDPVAREALRVGAYQLLFLRTPAHAAVDDAVTAVRRARGAKLAGFVNALLRRVAAEGEPPLPQDPTPPSLALRHSMPLPLVEDALRRFGPVEGLRFLAALNEPAPTWLRLNLLRGGRDEALAAVAGLVTPSERLPEAARVTGGDGGELFQGAAYREGWFTAQDLGAQLVGRLACAMPLPPGPLLDACAGTGGKTTHLCALLENAVEVDAADLSPRKLELCEEHLRRLGCRGVRTVACDAGDPAAPLRAGYALVLLDAPCSGLGVLRRHPEARWRLRPGQVAELSAGQARLLAALAPRVLPGGLLCYAVCTYTDEEGPQQVASFLEAHPDFAVEPPPDDPDRPVLRGLIDDRGHLRTWPHRDGTDGFFAVRLRRRGSS